MTFSPSPLWSSASSEPNDLPERISELAADSVLSLTVLSSSTPYFFASCPLAIFYLFSNKIFSY